MKSKEEKILGLFFNEPTREWHFEEILREAKITRSKADGWLKKFVKKKLIRKIKENGKMPYYISDYESFYYRNRKKLFALNILNNSGLLSHLSSLNKAKTVIIFGSFARSDWHKDSDIDLFIYGKDDGLRRNKYESILHRDIQLFVCNTIEKLNKLGDGLIKNIIKGNIVKGDIDFVKINA